MIYAVAAGELTADNLRAIRQRAAALAQQVAIYLGSGRDVMGRALFPDDLDRTLGRVVNRRRVRRGEMVTLLDAVVPHLAVAVVYGFGLPGRDPAFDEVWIDVGGQSIARVLLSHLRCLPPVDGRRSLLSVLAAWARRAAGPRTGYLSEPVYARAGQRLRIRARVGRDCRERSQELVVLGFLFQPEGELTWQAQP